jgi:hypothetical protein
LFPSALNADRAPQLKSVVGCLFVKKMVMLSRKFFFVGFLVSLLLFVAANAYEYATVIGFDGDMPEPFGFPFSLGSYGGFVGVTNLFLPGLFADIMVSLVVSLIGGLLFNKILSRGFVVPGAVMAWHNRTRL